MATKILLVEDDESTASALQQVLQGEGYTVTVAVRGDQALTLAQAQPFDLVITDLRLPGLSGMDLMAQLHTARPKLPIIVITAHGTTETAIEAMKLGACEYLVKPFEADELLDVASAAERKSRLMSEPVEIGTPHPIIMSANKLPKDLPGYSGWIKTDETLCDLTSAISSSACLMIIQAISVPIGSIWRMQ